MRANEPREPPVMRAALSARGAGITWTDIGSAMVVKMGIDETVMSGLCSSSELTPR